jgi:hypothetical protein
MSHLKHSISKNNHFKEKKGKSIHDLLDKKSNHIFQNLNPR